MYAIHVLLVFANIDDDDDDDCRATKSLVLGKGQLIQVRVTGQDLVQVERWQNALETFGRVRCPPIGN